jgi:hypothetical protein
MTVLNIPPNRCSFTQARGPTIEDGAGAGAIGMPATKSPLSMEGGTASLAGFRKVMARRSSFDQRLAPVIRCSSPARCPG